MAEHLHTIALIDLAVEGSDTGLARIESALRRLDGLTLLEWCIRRLSESTLIDAIVVTGPASFRSQISKTGLCNARWMPSPLGTPSLRACEIAERMGAQWIVFSSPLCPFTDPSLIDRLVSRGWSNPGVDFVGFVAASRPNFSLQSLGLVGEMCSSTALGKLKRAGLTNEACDVPDLIRRNPSIFQSKLLPLPGELENGGLRFQMETEADWEHASSLLEAVGDDLSWQRLAQVSERNQAWSGDIA